MYRLALLLILSGCVVNNHKVTQGPYNPEPKVYTLVCDETCTDADTERLKLLEDKINRTIRSQCFADFMLTPNRPWNFLEGRKPRDVLEKMREPRTVLVRYFFSPFWRLQGYDVAEQAVVNINRASVTVQRMNLCAEAAVIAHEIAHANGFNHRGNDPDEFNQFTPPYQVNHAFEPRREDYRNGGCCI